MSKKFDNQYDLIHCPEDLDKYYRVADERYIAGHAIGIVAIDLQYPKMPGNVVNALTYKYPVLYKKVEFEIERLFEGDPTIKDDIIAAAKALEADGVRPGKNTGVGCHFLLQCMKVKSESEVAQSCPAPSDPMDCSLPGSSIHGIFQARVLEWGAIAFSDYQ